MKASYESCTDVNTGRTRSFSIRDNVTDEIKAHLSAPSGDFPPTAEPT